MIPLWIPPATGPEELGRTRQATTADGGSARYTVESEDHDEQTRTRRTHTRYELHRGVRVERVNRDWIIHWHTPDGFAALARAAGLDVIDVEPVVDGEFTAYLQQQ